MAKRKDTSKTLGEQIAQHILSNYDLKDAQDVQNVTKQIFGPIFESMLKGEMENHLGYEKHEHVASCDTPRQIKPLPTKAAFAHKFLPITIFINSVPAPSLFYLASQFIHK